jgi:hypothetical protein
MDGKQFRFNDIVPIAITNPVNSEQYICTVSADANGYTWLL